MPAAAYAPPAAAAGPEYGRQTKKRPKWPWIVGGVVVVAILAQCGGADDDATDSPPAARAVATIAPTEDAGSSPAVEKPTEEPTPAEDVEEVVAAPVPAPEPPPSAGYGEFPADEAAFSSLVATAQQAAQGTENDMQVAAAKATRDAGICSLLPGKAVSGWSGKVSEVGANGDGKGILTVEIAPEVEIGTWNNFLSDALDDTLIEPSSSVFASAATLTEGQLVRFSGQFIDGSDPECLRESSLTLRGGVEDPSFIFRFSEVTPY